MALNDTIKTRVLLRNDTLARWGTSTLVLGKGEVAIATGLDGNLVEVRVGDGTTTWSGAQKLAIDASQISGITNLIEGTAKKYQIVANGDTTNSWKLQEAALSGGAWSDVSTFSVDFTSITNAIDGLTGDVDYISGVVDAKLDNDTFSEISNAIGLSAANAGNPVATKLDIAALDNVMHFKGVVAAIPTETTGYNVGDVVLVATSDPDSLDNGKEFVLVNVGTDQSPSYKWEKIGDQNAISALTEYVNTELENLSDAVVTGYATKTEVSDISSELTGQIGDLETEIGGVADTVALISDDYLTSTDKTELTGLISTTSANAVSEANNYTDGKISELNIDNYATKSYVNGISSELSTTAHNEITAVVGETTDLSTVNTLYGIKKYAEGYTDAAIADLDIGSYATESYVNGISSDLSTDYIGKIGTAKTEAYNEALSDANDYTNGQIASLSDTYIKHGEVTQDELSGFFVFDCGDSVIRTNEPTA